MKYFYFIIVIIIITGKKKYPPITFEYSQEEIAAKAGIKVGIKSGLQCFFLCKGLFIKEDLLKISLGVIILKIYNNNDKKIVDCFHKKYVKRWYSIIFDRLTVKAEAAATWPCFRQFEFIKIKYG